MPSLKAIKVLAPKYQLESNMNLYIKGNTSKQPSLWKGSDMIQAPSKSIP